MTGNRFPHINITYNLYYSGALSASQAVEALKGSEDEVRARLVCLSNLLTQHIADEATFDGSWADSPSPTMLSVEVK